MDPNDDWETRVVDRFTARTRVTMEWEVDAEYETTEGGRVRCVGWLADPRAVFDHCKSTEAGKTTIERLGVVIDVPPGDPLSVAKFDEAGA